MAEKIIYLTEEELEKCREFSKKSALQQQEIEYGESKTKPRTKEEIAHDNLIGKIAEVAFSKMMKADCNIDIDLDFAYYPRGKWDSQDAEYNGWKIDVKSTRIGRWMLIEWNKLEFRQKDNQLSHLYVMFSVDWKDGNPTGRVVYRGFATLARLSKKFPKTEVLLMDSALPGTRLESLQTDNYGIRFEDLYSYPQDLYDLLTTKRPIKQITDNYRNPRTGQTTLEVQENKRYKKEQFALLNVKEARMKAYAFTETAMNKYKERCTLL